MGRPVGVTFTVCIKILKTLKLKIHPKSDKRGSVDLTILS